METAQQGDVSAQVEMAQRYATGQGVEQNEAEANRWLQMAEQQYSTPQTMANGNVVIIKSNHGVRVQLPEHLRVGYVPPTTAPQLPPGFVSNPVGQPIQPGQPGVPEVPDRSALEVSQFIVQPDPPTLTASAQPPRPELRNGLLPYAEYEELLRQQQEQARMEQLRMQQSSGTMSETIMHSLPTQNPR